MQYPIIAERLIAFKNADLEMRDRLSRNGQLGQGYNEEMEKLHNHNAEALDQLITTIGYPTIDKVGVEGHEAAWLIIQHSISKPAFMKKCVKLMENESGKNRVNPKHLAYLTDRVATFQGKPQLYGTQFDWDENGELQPSDYDDLYKVNQRRVSVGMNTLEEQTAIIRKQAREENQSAPTNHEGRKKELEAWKQKVGWIG